ncbi:MAG: ABC transporter permease [Lachnospiraceae bacterium]|nr:ABC transporter permease [Lachnospiraceae bacterium]MEE3460949.1 ABC transporter permease [Lachnospiraceae bacterium]
MTKKWLKYAWLILVISFMYLPIIILGVYSFSKSTMIGHLRGFTLRNYYNLFTTSELIRMIVGTIVLAIIVSLLSTLLGTIGSIGIFYSKKRTKTIAGFMNQIPVVNADVVTGFSVCVLFIVLLGMNKESFIPLVIGQTVLCTPFVYLSVVPRLKGMDPNLYEAALDLGCNPGQALRKVVLPELVPGIVSGFMTSVTLSLDDYFIAAYTKPAAFDTISTYVVNATKGAQTDIKTALWALSTVIFVLVAGFVIARYLLTEKKYKQMSSRRTAADIS